MPQFRAEVVFTFEAPGLDAGGRRLHELQQAARDVGFELHRAEVHPDEPPDEDTGRGSPYAAM